MKSVLRSIFGTVALLVVLSMIPTRSYAVTDTISGIINICTPVIAIDSCNATLVVEKSLGFKANDRVILIQMQGATISVADDSTYGNLVSLGSAGNYELTTIERVIGKTVQLKYRLERPYDVKGSVQLVRVPHYTGNLVVDSVLTAPKWNGKCGGVLALIVDSTMYVESVVNFSGCGFRGGTFAAPGDSTAQQGYDYLRTSGRSGMKGESIVNNSLNVRAGRGKQANGGGGGNGYYSGGGGGGNAGAGGEGGKQYNGAAGGAIAVGGRGGVSITDTNSSDRLFLGGGGGSGHQNGHYEGGIQGGSGGGIIFLRCKTLDVSPEGYIYAEGIDVGQVTDSSGVGGGGGGGTIVLDIDSINIADVLTEPHISASGGNGGRISNLPNVVQCCGPGGGGGGGKILISNVESDSSFSALDYSGGTRGYLVSGDTECDGPDNGYGSVGGSIGFYRTLVAIIESSIPR